MFPPVNSLQADSPVEIEKSEEIALEGDHTLPAPVAETGTTEDVHVETNAAQAQDEWPAIANTNSKAPDSWPWVPPLQDAYAQIPASPSPEPDESDHESVHYHSTGSHENLIRRPSTRRVKDTAKLYLLISKYLSGMPAPDRKIKDDGEDYWAFMTAPTKLSEFEGSYAHYNHPIYREGVQYATSDLSKMTNFRGVKFLLPFGNVEDMEGFVDILKDVQPKKGIKYKGGRSWYGAVLAELQEENKRRKKAGRKELVDLPGWHKTMLSVGRRMESGCIVQ